MKSEYLIPADKQYSLMRKISFYLFKKGMKSEIERSFVSYLIFNTFDLMIQSQLRTLTMRKKLKK